jgi:hypothetical protein
MAPAVLALRSYRTMAQGWHKIRVMPQRHAREEPTQRQAELLGAIASIQNLRLPWMTRSAGNKTPSEKIPMIPA